MEGQSNPVIEAIERRFHQEPYACRMGMKLVGLQPGRAVIEMAFGAGTANMLGGPHGGAIFSLIDAAFELSSNSHGTVALALNCNVSYLRASAIGDILRAESREVSLSRQIGTYFIEVRNAAGDLIATCDAMAYRKADPLPFLHT